MIKKAFGKLLKNWQTISPAFLAHLLTLPGEIDLLQEFSQVQVDALVTAREFVLNQLAETFQEQWKEIYLANAETKTFSTDSAAIGQRSLKNMALRFISRLETKEARKIPFKQFQKSTNMTDTLAALACLTNTECDEREEALTGFLDKWKDDSLVMNKWFAVQAISKLPNTVEKLHVLSQHPQFDPNNPNKVYSLYREFGRNLSQFHRKDGEGYKFVSDKVIDLDGTNPQVAARIVGVFNQWKKFDSKRQELMKTELKRIVEKPGLSPNVYEIVSRNLEP